MSAQRPPPDYKTVEWDRAMSTIPHRLQSPVSAIQIYAQLLRKAAPEDDEELLRSIAGIEASARELNRVIHTLSQARAVGIDALDVYIEETDVGELVEEFVGELSGGLKERPINVTVADDVSAPVDRILVREILEELIENATRFSRKESVIELTIEQAGDGVEISVTDAGTGIPPEQHDDVFEAFVKLDPNRSGLGLGLYVARGAARAQRGDLTVGASADGGCRFTLTLPLR